MYANENMPLFLTFDKLNFLLNLTPLFSDYFVAYQITKTCNDNAANDTDIIYKTVNRIYINPRKKCNYKTCPITCFYFQTSSIKTYIYILY